MFILPDIPNLYRWEPITGDCLGEICAMLFDRAGLVQSTLESPIEAEFSWALLSLISEARMPYFTGSGKMPDVGFLKTCVDRHIPITPIPCSGINPNYLTILTQVPVLNYRADFVIGWYGEWFNVECDGKEFHTKPWQVSRDDARNQAFLKHGLHVYRIPGSIIRRDNERAALDFLKFVSDTVGAKLPAELQGMSYRV